MSIGTSDISFSGLRTKYIGTSLTNAADDEGLQSNTDNISLSDFRGATFYGGTSVPETDDISVNSVFKGKKFSPEGLLLRLDANDENSYSGSGTTWSDVAGDNDGTLINGTAFDTGNSRSFVFDGINDRVDISNISTGDFNGDATLLCWLECDSNSPDANQTGIFGWGSALYTSHYVWTNGLAYFDTFREARVENISLSPPSIDRTTPHLLAITTRAGGDWKLYQNTTLVTSTTAESTIVWDNASFGSDGVNTYNFQGKIYSISIYNRELSSSEITEQYNALVSQYPSLELHLDAGDETSYPGSGTTWTDLSGNNDGTLVNGPLYESTNSGGLSFDGTDDRVDVSNISTSDFNGDATLLCWLECDSNSPSANQTGIFGWGGSTVRSHYVWTNGLAYFDTFRNNRVENISLSPTLDRTTPHLLAITTRAGGDWKLYQNTTLVTSTTAETTIVWNNATIGTNGSDQWRFQGTVYALLIYDRELTLSEITEQYNSLISRFQ